MVVVRFVSALLLVATLLVGCADDPTPAATPPRQLRAAVLAEHPHATDAFTEGLVFLGRNRLMESVGLYGVSELREADPTTGEIRARRALPADVFAEGLGAAGERLVQLTWREGRALVWDSATLGEQRGFRYAGEGWGLAFDRNGRRWVQSDGSSTLLFRDPETFEVLGRLEVRRRGRPVLNLNELEVVGDHVWANVWRTTELVRIDLGDGRVDAVVDLSSLRAPDTDRENVLNGIAHRPGDPPERLWVTGKRWPRTYEIEVS